MYNRGQKKKSKHHNSALEVSNMRPINVDDAVTRVDWLIIES